MARILVPYSDFVLDRASFRADVKPSHLEKVEGQEPKMLIHAEAVDAPKMAPPANSSMQTKNELTAMAQLIQQIGPKEQQKAAEKYDENFIQDFKKLADECNIAFDEKAYQALLDESTWYILKLKYLYNRPRPYQLAPLLGIDLGHYETTTSKTPSFPSGHTTQAYLLYNVIKNLHPEHSEVFEQLAEKVSQSRFIGGLHFPTDIEYGKQLAFWLASHSNIGA